MFLRVRDTMVNAESVAFIRRFQIEEALAKGKQQYGIRIGFKSAESVINMMFDTEAESKKYYDQLASMMDTVNLN